MTKLELNEVAVQFFDSLQSGSLSSPINLLYQLLSEKAKSSEDNSSIWVLIKASNVEAGRRIYTFKNLETEDVADVFDLDYGDFCRNNSTIRFDSIPFVGDGYYGADRFYIVREHFFYEIASSLSELAFKEEKGYFQLCLENAYYFVMKKYNNMPNSQVKGSRK